MKRTASLIAVVLILISSGFALADENGSSLYLPIVLRANGNTYCLPAMLVSPANGSALDTLVPLLQWDRGDNTLATRLTIQVSLDPTFAGPSHTTVTTSANWVDEFRFPRNFNESSTYYWRASVMCDTVGPIYSSVWSFTTPGSVTRLPAPILVSPEDESYISGTSVNLEWQPVTGALEYLVKIQRAGTTSYSFAFVPAAQLNYTYTIIPEVNRYDWWVSAVNSGAVGDESERWQFDTP